MARTSDRKKSTRSEKAEVPVAEDDSAIDHHQPAKHDFTDERQEAPGKSDQDATKEKRRKQRDLRRQSREVTRTRSTGLGLSISSDAAPSNKRRIVFDDNGARDDEQDSDGMNDKKIAGETVDDSVDDSDDEDVEEIQSNVARAKALHQRAEEREIVEMNTARPRRKKSRAAVESKDSKDVEFDEHFFAQVDSEVAEARQEKRAQKLGLEQHTGKHTTFVAADEQGMLTDSVEADHNIELVVLGDGSLGRPGAVPQQAGAGDTLGIAPTKASILFGGKMLPNGNDSTMVKSPKKKQADGTGWKRSKKTSSLLVSRSRVKRRKGGAGPAARFAVK